MNSRFLTPAALATAILLAACSSTPLTTSNLVEARSEYVSASNNADVAKYAPREFRQATEALNEANTAAEKRADVADVDRLAYLAKQKLATAQEIARAKAAEARVADGARERDAVRLEARTAEADRAKREAAEAQAQAAAAEEKNRALTARTAKLEGILSELHAKKTDRGMVVTIGDVLFATGQATLAPNAMVTLRKLAEVMAQNPERSVLVEGFTDSTGSNSLNQALSQRRADSVATALGSLGVARQRISTRAYGPAFPVASNDNAADRQLNRRVEIVLSNDGSPIPARQ